MPLTDREAEAIRNSIETAMTNAREAERKADRLERVINRLVEKVNRIGEAMQNLRRSADVEICPHCGERIRASRRNRNR